MWGVMFGSNYQTGNLPVKSCVGKQRKQKTGKNRAPAIPGGSAV
jgi:hypothetical protein